MWQTHLSQISTKERSRRTISCNDTAQWKATRKSPANGRQSEEADHRSGTAAVLSRSSSDSGEMLSTSTSATEHTSGGGHLQQTECLRHPRWLFRAVRNAVEDLLRKTFQPPSGGSRQAMRLRNRRVSTLHCRCCRHGLVHTAPASRARHRAQAPLELRAPSGPSRRRLLTKSLPSPRRPFGKTRPTRRTACPMNRLTTLSASGVDWASRGAHPKQKKQKKTKKRWSCATCWLLFSFPSRKAIGAITAGKARRLDVYFCHTASRKGAN